MSSDLLFGHVPFVKGVAIKDCMRHPTTESVDSLPEERITYQRLTDEEDACRLFESLGDTPAAAASRRRYQSDMRKAESTGGGRPYPHLTIAPTTYSATTYSATTYGATTYSERLSMPATPTGASRPKPTEHSSGRAGEPSGSGLVAGGNRRSNPESHGTWSSMRGDGDDAADNRRRRRRERARAQRNQTGSPSDPPDPYGYDVS
jgi:hypothetical protein